MLSRVLSHAGGGPLVDEFDEEAFLDAHQPAKPPCGGHDQGDKELLELADRVQFLFQAETECRELVFVFVRKYDLLREKPMLKCI